MNTKEIDKDSDTIRDNLIKDKILEHLKKDSRRLPWLEEKTEIPYNTLYSCLVLRLFKLSDENLEKINKLLGTDFK